MEKLLSTIKKQGGKYARTLRSQGKKTFALAVGATANVFCQRTGKTHKKTTYFRMDYLRQPIAGFIH